MQLGDFKKVAEVSSSQVARKVYSFDATEIEGRTKAVVWPENTEDVSKIIKIANREKIPITIRGAGTSLAGGAVPDEDIVMDMSKMNKIIEIKDKTATVEAGVVISDLNDELRTLNLEFPVKPASHKVCHIGGAAATNAAGEKALRYGKMRKWIESVRIVFPDASVRWEDPDIFVGSEGIYGVITELKLKLKKPAEKTSISVFEFDSIDEIIEKIKELKSKAVSIEMVNKKASQIAELGEKNFLLVEFEDDSGQITDPKEIEKKWEIREGMGPILTSTGHILMEDPQIPENKMAEFLRWLEEKDIPAFGHIAIGIVHPRFARGSDLIDEMFEFIQKIGGDISGEHGIGLTKKKYLDPKAKQEIVKLKKKYDPNSILNRGKVI